MEVIQHGEMDEKTRLAYFPRKERNTVINNIAERYKNDIIANQIANRLYEKALRSDAALREADPKSNKLLKPYRINELEKLIGQNNQIIAANYEALRVMADFQIENIAAEQRDEAKRGIKQKQK